MKSKPENIYSDDLGRPLKSYTNLNFLTSPDARLIRVLCEMIEPRQRLRRQHIRNTIVFFGSARTLPKKVAENNIKKIREKYPEGSEIPASEQLLYTQALNQLTMSSYYEKATCLSEILTKWSMGIKERGQRFFICSGGGPGIMEAANKGAKLAGGKSLSLNISIPHEQNLNPYQTPELAFEFHYFFIRKFWFFYLAKALVVFPGGFGTLDELFELLTLVQTNKIKKFMPIVLFGKDYWNEVVNFEALVKWGTLSPQDLELFHLVDNIDEAYDILTSEITKNYLNK